MLAGTAGQRFLRILGALPDALIAVFCLYVWIAPARAGVDWVKQIVVAMLVEFLAVHSGAFFSGRIAGHGWSWQRAGVSVLLASVYLLFAGAFSLAFGTWWPLQSMAILLAIKAWTYALDRDTSSREEARQFAIWGASVGLYLIGAMITTILPIPELGIDAAVRSAAELPGSGLWVEQPQRVVAFAMLYFGALAWTKLKLDPLAPGPTTQVPA